MEDLLPILWVVLGIVLLMILTVKVKLNSILSLLIVAILVAFLEGMDGAAITETITNGLSSTWGGLALIVILGAVLGQLMTDSGGSKKIADTVIEKFGVKYLQWGLIIIGLIFGLAMFYEVAFMILAPLILSIAREAKLPYMKLIIPAIAAATMSHSIFPPQPGPVALVDAYGADIGQVYILGLIMIIPTVICAGIILPKFLKGIDDLPLPTTGIGASPVKESDVKLGNEKEAYSIPSFRMSVFVPLIPAIFMIGSTIFSTVLPKENGFVKVFSFLGDSNISMLIAVLVATYIFGIHTGRTLTDVGESISTAIKGIANVIVVIGAGGVFKQVIIDAGVGQHIANAIAGVNISPLILAWLITVIMRLATGQGAVSAITAAAIVGPLMLQFDVNPALMVLATAAGSNTMTLPNDASFWLFKETFNLSMGQTFKTWGLLELVNSLVGLAIVLIMSLFI